MRLRNKVTVITGGSSGIGLGIAQGVNRYGLLKKSIPGISEKMLTQRLKDLENQGLIVRKDFKTIPPHVEYSLSESGKTLIPVLEQLCNWGTEVRLKTKSIRSELKPVENNMYK